MEPRISLITLGVASVAISAAFYTRLGFSRAKDGDEHVAFFQLGSGLVLALYDRSHLVRDAGIEDSRASFGGITLAHNTRSALEVDKLVAAFVAAGGRLLKEPGKASWGGYFGYVADPDGHIWEIAHNPHWELDETGGLNIPG